MLPLRELTHRSERSSKLPPVIFALSTSQEIALATMGGVFIVFSVISAFVLPTKSPNFPGKHMPIYLVLCVVLFLAMMATVLVFGKEKKEAEGEPAVAAATASTGDAANGKTVFTANGCGACHVLADADAAGAVGPNLDETKPAADVIVDRVTNGKGTMPAFAGKLTDEQIQDVAAYIASVA